MKLPSARLETPLGTLVAAFHDGRLVGLGFESRWRPIEEHLARRYGSVTLGDGAERDAMDALRAYFSGDVLAIDRIPVHPGGTPFQERVWNELRRVAAGTTVSYSGLAARIGDAKSVRAVAAANARNPIPIVIPCHRVVAKDGSLHGYGYGLPAKRWLLVHEGALLA